jgi:CRISPR-associated protein Cas1
VYGAAQPPAPAALAALTGALKGTLPHTEGGGKLPKPAKVAPPTGLVAQALVERNLFAAWERVRENDGAGGVDGVEIEQFGQNVLGRLALLRGEFLKGLYQPQPLKRVSIPKPNGGERWLAIPTVRDRVLQTAVAQVLRPVLEPEFEDASFAYRPGRSVAMAVARVQQLRDAGAQHVLEADIEGFFDHVHHATLLAKLRRTVKDEALCQLVAQWLAGVVQHSATPQASGAPSHTLLTEGIPQGSPLSPLLANLYLDDFDEALLEHHPGLVRYADDFVVMLPSAELARLALQRAEAALRSLRLKLNTDKTRLTHFNEGFVFLGVRFIGTLSEAVDPAAAPWLLPKPREGVGTAARPGLPPTALAGAAGETALPEQAEPSEAWSQRSLHSSGDPALAAALGEDDALDEAEALQVAAEPIALPLLNSLVVGEHGCWLSKEGARVVVSQKKQVMASVPLGQLDQITIAANTMLSSALLRDCARRRIQVFLADPHGQGGATLDRGALPDLALLDVQRQRLAQDGFALQMARQLVEGKLHNSKVLLRRFTRREGREAAEEAVARIDASLSRLGQAQTLDQVRGLEGIAARAYFEAFAHLLPPELGFAGRKRRPPPDPVNAMLSLGYSVLASNVHTLLRLSGLNVHLGSLHQAGPATQALVSDLMEEFRAPVVDAVVLTLCRERRIQAHDFETDPGGEWPCRLQREARRVFLAALEAKLQSRFIHPRHKKVMDMRRAMQAQQQHYLRVLRRQELRYLALKFR